MLYFLSLSRCISKRYFSSCTQDSWINKYIIITCYIYIYKNIYIIEIYNFLNINLYENFNERIMDNVVNRYIVTFIIVVVEH